MTVQLLQVPELARQIDDLLTFYGMAHAYRSEQEPGPLPPQLEAVLSELQPYDVSLVLEALPELSRLVLLYVLEPQLAAEALGYLEHDQQYHLLDHLPERKIRAIIAVMPSDALVDLLGAVHPKQAQEILKRVPSEDVAQVKELMSYPEHSAGGLMTFNYLTARTQWTAAQVIDHFRKVAKDIENANYVYVVDKVGRLAGVASLRDIILAAPGVRVAEIMYTKVISIAVDADQEEVARLLSQYDFSAIPVVNHNDQMVGIITVDDIIDVVEEEATEDIQLIGGTEPFDKPYLQAGIRELFSKRIGWLLVLFLAESLTGSIMRSYEDVLSQMIALTFFIPLLIDTGGNSGSQASTLVIRAMALGEVTPKDYFKIIWREIRLGLLLGTAMGLVAYARALFMGGPITLGITVALTIIMVVVVSTTAGATLPMIGKRFGLDPAVFSAPLITTIADGVGLLIYFRMAQLIIGIGG
jgi:magnesium transporter